MSESEKSEFGTVGSYHRSHSTSHPYGDVFGVAFGDTGAVVLRLIGSLRLDFLCLPLRRTHIEVHLRGEDSLPCSFDSSWSSAASALGIDSLFRGILDYADRFDLGIGSSLAGRS